MRVFAIIFVILALSIAALTALKPGCYRPIPPERQEYCFGDSTTSDNQSDTETTISGSQDA